MKSCDIIGNEEGVARVYNWLSKWKYSNPKGTTNPPLIPAIPVIPVIPVIPDNSDPDFSIPIRHRSRIVNNSMNSSFSSNSDDDNEMGVAMLLCGPVGCGKTASVYTCATY